MLNYILSTLFLGLVALGIASFLYITEPAVDNEAHTQAFEVLSGQGARAIAKALEAQGIIRSASGFYLVSVVTWTSAQFKPGAYELSGAMSAHEIIKSLVRGPDRERVVLVREGDTIYDVDATLVAQKVLQKGALLAADASSMLEREGRLFPDTYRFYVSSTIEEVLKKFENNFQAKAAPLLGDDGAVSSQTLILASILEKEVPEIHDRQVVAGILLKRVANDVPLQVDATICYVKIIEKGGATPCYPIDRVDLEKRSPYNTYTNRGWPPRPIGNPGVGAITAALDPIRSPYWYYLSDPATKKTIFATTLDEHNSNRVKYLPK